MWLIGVVLYDSFSLWLSDKSRIRNVVPWNYGYATVLCQPEWVERWALPTILHCAKNEGLRLLGDPGDWISIPSEGPDRRIRPGPVFPACFSQNTPPYS